MSFVEEYLSCCKQVVEQLSDAKLEAMVERLLQTRESGGRLFVLGSGGGAGHASHAVCDFRKLCNIEAYAPYDNISELTARVNDEGWESTITNWLKVSHFNKKDCLFVFSVGGGNANSQISMNLVGAIKLAKEVGAGVLGVVGKDGGFTAKEADACLVIPNPNPAMVTPITEGFQAVIWHCIVSHPKLQVNACKWESVAK
jgi:D-sedoheptulose 7-phosphate isomerase